jgi:hypothetical protein
LAALIKIVALETISHKAIRAGPAGVPFQWGNSIHARDAREARVIFATIAVCLAEVAAPGQSAGAHDNCKFVHNEIGILCVLVIHAGAAILAVTQFDSRLQDGIGLTVKCADANPHFIQV